MVVLHGGTHIDKDEERSARGDTYRGMRDARNCSTLKVTVAILKLILWRT